MKANINFSEINQLLGRKGIKATLSSGYQTNSFRVYYPLKILFVKKDVSVTIKLKGYSATVINWEFSLNGLGSLENKAKKVIKKKLPSFITLVNDKELKVDVGNIQALKKAGIRVKINNLVINDSGFIADLNI